MSEFLVRLRGDHLNPDGYRNGDILTVREAATADEGQLAVVTGEDGVAMVRRYAEADGLTVFGVVTGMNRRIP